MNLKKYIESLSRIQNNFNNTSATFANIQNQIAVSVSPFIDLQNRINEISIPVSNFQSRIALIYESLDSTLKYYENISQHVNSNMQNILQNQYRIAEYLSSFDFSPSSITISNENSIKFSETYLETINELDFTEFPEGVEEIADLTLEISQQKNILTWEQIIIIITFIINITLFLQAQLPEKPNGQLIEIENSLNQLIELQTKEIDLLKQISE